jgi:hypothetical protein
MFSDLVSRAVILWGLFSRLALPGAEERPIIHSLGKEKGEQSDATVIAGAIPL